MTAYLYSQECVSKLCSLESFRPLPYKDGGGLWTTGYGRRCEADAPETNKDAEQRWVEGRLIAICQKLEVLLPGLFAYQVDALCLFIYNIGIEAFETSDTCRLLKARAVEALAHWRAWIHDARGNVEGGLITRRDYETELFVYGYGA